MLSLSSASAFIVVAIPALIMSITMYLFPVQAINVQENIYGVLHLNIKSLFKDICFLISAIWK